MATPSPSPLAGRRVVVTRAVEQSVEMVQQLQQLGAEVLLLPSVAFVGPEDTSTLDAAIRTLGTFDWLVFTSGNAVRFFCARAEKLGADVCAPQGKGLQIAAVGSATAEAARSHKLRVDFAASTFRGEALAKELSPRLKNKKVLLPRSDRARRDLPDALRQAGALVTDVIAYCTVAAESSGGEILSRIRGGEVDVITFASPSAFHSFVDMASGDEALRRRLSRCALAAIGPTTAAAIREAGFRVAIEAAQSTATGLVAAIVAYYSERSSSGAATR